MSDADLTVCVSNDGPWVAGGTGAYTVVVSVEPGFGPSEKLVAVEHFLPAGLTARSATGQGWSCSITGHEVSCMSKQPLSAGESYPPVRIEVAVDRRLSGAVSARTAISVAGSEADTTNNTATSTAEVAPVAG
ncbi:hypothetical protein ACOBQX_04300 [Actinokineospora sp. G85]|uniref:hypothetical protein n=1 Tax=Actinokineospora sp. G85 TaxID=3406626 RepID=UPI003C724439